MKEHFLLTTHSSAMTAQGGQTPALDSSQSPFPEVTLPCRLRRVAQALCEKLIHGLWPFGWGRMSAVFADPQPIVGHTYHNDFLVRPGASSGRR